jgi:hypothetical protein
MVVVVVELAVSETSKFFCKSEWLIALELFIVTVAVPVMDKSESMISNKNI